MLVCTSLAPSQFKLSMESHFLGLVAHLTCDKYKFAFYFSISSFRGRKKRGSSKYLEGGKKKREAKIRRRKEKKTEKEKKIKQKNRATSK